MDRRGALKNLVVISGGAIALPQWMLSCGASDTPIHQTSFSVSAQKTLASIVDTIIPAGSPGTTGSPGALTVGVDKFLQKLIDDCYKRDIQDNVKLQLSKLHGDVWAQTGKPFADHSQAGREKLLLRLSDSKDKREKDFFDLIKSETIRGFSTSQKVMTEFLGYQVAPGHYYGCVDVSVKDHA